MRNSRLHLLLLPCPSLRLRLIRLGLLLSWVFMSLLSFSPVSAGDVYDEPTPSPTFQPLFPSSTPGGDSFTCPDGVPVGYLTVTPDLVWDALCHRCLPTAVPGPTSTPGPTSLVGSILTATHEAQYGTNTPFPTVTSVVTGSPTLVSTSLDLLSYSGWDYAALPGTYAWLNYWGGGDGSAGYVSSVSCSLLGSSSNPYIACHIVSTLRDLSAAFSAQSNVRVSISGASGYYVTVNSSSLYADGEHHYRVALGSQVNDWHLVGFDGSVYLPSATTGLTYLDLRHENIGQWGWYAAEFDVTINPVGYYTPTPYFPASTPTPGYCGVVRNEDLPQDGIVIPPILVGQSKCGGFNGITVPFSWFQLVGFDLPDLSIPSIHLCFQPAQFGKLVIVGNEIDLDAIAYVLGVLFLLSLIF